jgi:hypothetical protein
MILGTKMQAKMQKTQNLSLIEWKGGTETLLWVKKKLEPLCTM